MRSIAFLLILGTLSLGASTEAPKPAYSPAFEVLISVKEQRLAVRRNGAITAEFPISTSRFGLGDRFGSYKTPVGRMRIHEKIGGGLKVGAVLKGRNPTGEVLAPNTGGRDPIVTRILWLEGLEPGNQNARPRNIYIHGTPQEKRIGRPVSYGCVRMRSVDVMQLFAKVEVGTPVTVIPGKLPRPTFSIPFLANRMVLSGPSDNS